MNARQPRTDTRGASAADYYRVSAAFFGGLVVFATFAMMLCEVPWWHFAPSLLVLGLGLPSLLRIAKSIRPSFFAPAEAFVVVTHAAAVAFNGVLLVAVAMAQYEEYGTLAFTECGGPRVQSHRVASLDRTQCRDASVVRLPDAVAPLLRY